MAIRGRSIAQKFLLLFETLIGARNGRSITAASGAIKSVMASLYGPLVLTLILVSFAPTCAQAETRKILITNASIFDGHSAELIEGSDILIEDELIALMAPGIPAADALVIDAAGRTMIPGLLDAHTHLAIVDSPETTIFKNHWGFNGALATVAAERMLLRGFTSVRDLGGPVTGLKQAIDQGWVPGPRILPSGVMISQTSGHGDFQTTDQFLNHLFPDLPSKQALFGWSLLADGKAEVMEAARVALRSGASQLKVMAGGGVSSLYDPLDATQYTLDELRAAVHEAEKWGTYVAVHAFTDAAANLSIDAGVKCIDHGPFLTEATLKRMAREDVWLSPQVFLFSQTPAQLGLEGTVNGEKMDVVNRKSARVIELAKKLGVNIAWSTDTFGKLDGQASQSREFVARQRYFSAYEILLQATSGNAALFALSGLRHPYGAGKLGVIQPGAYADILLIKGNPLQDITLLANPEENIDLIIKGGKIFKDQM